MSHEPPLCPLSQKSCIEQACAWWNKPSKRCSIWLLADELVSIEEAMLKSD